MFMLQIYFQCRLDPSQGPSAGATTFKRKVSAVQYAAPVIVLFLVVMGGIWFGIYTANEAGAIGVIGAFLYGLYKKRINRKSLTQAFRGSHDHRRNDFRRHRLR